jgi:hypothetical protein
MAPLAMAPLPPPPPPGRALQHLSLHLNSDYPLLLFPASPGLPPPQSPLSPSYQTRQPASPSWPPHHPGRAGRYSGTAPAAAVGAVAGTTDPAVPVHPIASMQAPFAESLYEAMRYATMPPDPAYAKPQLRAAGPDAKTRYDALLSEDSDAPPAGALWRYRPAQAHHELWRLEAQVAFGMHLLLRGVANDNAQVVAILQGHIDEIDEFLETALDDLSQGIHDLSERIGFMRLPMDNMAVFEGLLEKREFRIQITDGNEKIEHVLSRARRMLAQFDDDITHGLRATREFSAHLARERDGDWMVERIEVLPIYEAMRGNADGWMNAFGELGAKAAELDDLIKRLSGIVVFISAKAGEVSRKTWSAIPPFSRPPVPRPQSPAESVRSEYSQATRITGFPLPPSARRWAGQRQSRSSSAVLPEVEERKFFYDEEEEEGGEKRGGGAGRMMQAGTTSGSCSCSRYGMAMSCVALALARRAVLGLTLMGKLCRLLVILRLPHPPPPGRSRSTTTRATTTLAAAPTTTAMTATTTTKTTTMTTTRRPR